MIQYKVDFDSIQWESPIPGLRHKFLVQGSQKLRLVEYTGEMEPHWCEKGHIGYVLEGEMEIKFDAETFIYKKSDGIFIPGGMEHRHMGRVLTDVVKVIFVEDA